MAPRTSIRTSAAATISSPPDRLAPLQTSDVLFPSFETPGLATPAANTFLAVSQSPQPRNPYVQQWSIGVQREVFPSTVLELNYIGNKGTNLLMRRNIAQALPYSDCPADGRRAQAVPELRRLHRQRLERAVQLPRLQHQAGAPRALGAADLRLHLGQEHRHQVRRRRHRGDRLQRLAGVPRQPGSGARSRLVGLRRRSPTGRELRLQPADGRRRAVRRRCHRCQGGPGRRVAGERHLHLAARLPAHRHRGGSRRPERQLRHQSRRPGRRSEQRRAQHPALVQHRRLRPAGRRPVRDVGTQHPARPRA